MTAVWTVAEATHDRQPELEYFRFFQGGQGPHWSAEKKQDRKKIDNKPRNQNNLAKYPLAVLISVSPQKKFKPGQRSHQVQRVTYQDGNFAW